MILFPFTRYLTDNGRFEVRFAHGKLVSLSPVHLARLDVQVDDMVQVVGLESEGGRQFNGQRGVVLRFIEDSPHALFQTQDSFQRRQQSFPVPQWFNFEADILCGAIMKSTSPSVSA